MKKILLAMSVLVILITFQSCNNSGKSDLDIIDLSSYTHDPINNPDINLRIGLAPDGVILDGKVPYEAFVFWDNRGSSQRDGEFNDAQIYIDGIKMPLSGTDFFRLEPTDGLKYAPGDTIKVIVRHNSIGTRVKNLVVPENISSFTTNPTLTVGVDNSSDSIIMNWSNQSSDEYAVKMERGSVDSEFSSYTSYPSQNTYTWGSSYFYENTTFITKVKFSLMAQNRASFENLTSSSKVYVASPIPATIQNY